MTSQLLYDTIAELLYDKNRGMIQPVEIKGKVYHHHFTGEEINQIVLDLVKFIQEKKK